MNIFTNDKKIDLTLWLTYSCYIALLAVITLDAWSAQQHFWKVWLLQAVPLLLLMPGLIQKHYRSHSWLCFLILAYFTGYVVQVYSPTRGIYDWIGLMLTITLFISAMFASRWLQRLTIKEFN
ncbi:MAG: DUF2069 domain-containing protein [Cellvibrionaceae bacterium]